MSFLIKKNSNTGTKDLQKKDVRLLKATSPFAVREAYKSIRTNLIFTAPGDKCKKILVTSSTQGEKKSTTSINLGIAFANNEDKVLVIDCDLRLPTIAQKLGLKKTPGLTNALIGANSLDECIRHLKNGLDVMTSGDVPPNPSELLGSERFVQLVDYLSERYEYIIFDTPPVTTVSDALVISGLMSGVVIIVGNNIGTYDSVNDTVNRLKMAKAKILGFILTGVEDEKGKHYGKYSSYGYGYADSYAKAAAKTKTKNVQNASVTKEGSDLN